MRLAVFSNQRLDPAINWTTLGPPLLEPLAAKRDSELFCPGPLAWTHTREWLSLIRRVSSADIVFWMQGASRPELPIHFASVFCGRARRSAFVVDAWKYLITKIGALSAVQHLEPCFVAFAEAFDELSRRFPRARFEWLPFGVDTRVFDSAAASSERPIFAYWMGRRFEPLHQAMLRYCSARGLDYRYTQRPGEHSDPIELGKLVGQSRYFLVTPPNLADPQRTGGFSPFVMRYLEGLAAGARLLGTLPGSGEYQLLLPRDAILEVAADGADLEHKLDADRCNPEAAAAVRRAQTIVRDQHSWHRRAQQIYERICFGKTTGFTEIWTDRSRTRELAETDETPLMRQPLR